MRKKTLLILPFVGLLALLSFCDRTGEEGPLALQDRRGLPMQERYLNFHDTVSYVGMDACISCHPNVHATFQHNGMGMSFDKATKEKSAGQFGEHALVYDSVSNFYYKPFWQGDSLMVKEYRLDGTDTIHQRTEYISYIIGSGHHTNSHMVDFDGYVYQAPITFYTQKEQWDMAPGFAGGFNSRFTRLINMECMTCHNALPEHVEGSVNKYAHVPQGINCERCHGPGEVHVKTKMAGQIVDTSQHPDFTIVNPADLSVDLQMNLCQRCHLQGVAVLNEGRFWDDFKPGMHLKEVMQVFLPEYRGAGAEDQFLMASHVERLKESECFAAGELSCITCHNPHVSVRVSQQNHFNAACVDCHRGTQRDSCTEEIQQRILANNNDCSGCHMPKSASIDIPHVAITDHNIRIPDKEEQYRETIEGKKVREAIEFVGLRCMTDDAPSALTMARGYLRFYEGFASQRAYLDSAYYFLQRAQSEPLLNRIAAEVQYYYLTENFHAIRQLGQQVEPVQVNDGFTSYRIGDAMLSLGDQERAGPFLERAVALQPLNLEFLNKLGSWHIYQGQFAKAQNRFEKILAEQPKYVPALSNLGTLYLNLGNADEGLTLLQQAIALDPDYALAYLNLAEYHAKRFNTAKARQILEQLLRHQPDNQQAKQALRAMR